MKRWADDRGHVQLTDLAEGWTRTVSVAKAIVQVDFYTVETDSGPSDLVEHFLADIERTAARALNLVEHGTWPLAGDDRQALAQLVALQLTRSDAARQRSNEAVDKVSKMAMKMYAAHPDALRAILMDKGEDASDDAVARQAAFLARDDYTVRLSRTASVVGAIEVAEGLIGPIMAMKWDLVDLGEPLLATSDRPTAFWARAGKLPAWSGVGLATADEVTFPLGPSMCLRLTLGEEREPDGRIVPESGVRRTVAAMINTRTFQWAQRFVVCTPGARPFVLPEILKGQDDESRDLS